MNSRTLSYFYHTKNIHKITAQFKLWESGVYSKWDKFYFLQWLWAAFTFMGWSNHYWLCLPHCLFITVMTLLCFNPTRPVCSLCKYWGTTISCGMWYNQLLYTRHGFWFLLCNLFRWAIIIKTQLPLVPVRPMVIITHSCVTAIPVTVVIHTICLFVC